MRYIPSDGREYHIKSKIFKNKIILFTSPKSESRYQIEGGISSSKMRIWIEKNKFRRGISSSNMRLCLF